jgi:hypothetical protein
MKEPTTPYQQAMMDRPNAITKAFLLLNGWSIIDTFPLYEAFQHKKNTRLFAHIGMYGDFSITELHWMNDEPQKYFNTINADLITEDYNNIIRLLGIKI